MIDIPDMLLLKRVQSLFGLNCLGVFPDSFLTGHHQIILPTFTAAWKTIV
jgi:hypothetical protein